MTKKLVLANVVHLLNPEDFEDEVLEENENWEELSQFGLSILCYTIPLNGKLNLSQKSNFVDEAEYTYRFIHPAIAQTFKYTYNDHLSISYVGEKDSFYTNKFKEDKPSNTQKQIFLIAAASALLYLETKSVSLYCLDLDHLILDKDLNPKFLCAGLPSFFKPNNWNDKNSPAVVFGKFAKSLLSKDHIPSSMEDIINDCIRGKSDQPTLENILEFFSTESNYLDDVDECSINKYLDWLKFQDKFPCDYFYDLEEPAAQAMVDSLEDGENEELAESLTESKGPYPKDIQAALYYSGDSEFYISDTAQTFAARFGVPDWFKNLNDKYKNIFANTSSHTDTNIQLNCTCEMFVNKKHRAKLESSEESDVEFVVSSYLHGKNDFPKSSEAAFKYVKRLLEKPENRNNSYLYNKFGEMHENGIGTPISYIEANRYYELAIEADDDNSKASENIKRIKAKQKEINDKISNIDEENKHYLEKADNNYFRSAMYVAFSFLYGFNGFPQSHWHAEHYYMKASETDPYVLCMLGNLFRLGIGFPRNLEKAAHFYTLSNSRGCPRGRAYDGFMQMYKYSPNNITLKNFQQLDKYFFDFKNPQGKNHLYNYCNAIHMQQCHYPLLYNSVYIDGKSRYRNYSRDPAIDYRRPNDHYLIKETIEIDSANDTADRDTTLNKTEIQNSLWFLFYQLNYIYDNGMVLELMRPNVSVFKNNTYFLGIDSLDPYPYRWKRSSKPIARKLFKEIKKRFDPTLKEAIKSILREKDYDIKQILEHFETNMIDPEVDTDQFELFVRNCKKVVPYDSAKILIDSTVEKADSGDLECIRKCAFNYFYGLDSFPINFKESFKYYNILASDKYNDSNAQMYLGHMYSKGIAVNQSISEGLKWYKKSSDQNNIEGRLNYALFLEYYNRKLKNEKDPAIPFTHLLQSCYHTNDKESLFAIAKLRESHPSFNFGRSESIKYYQSAYRLGHIESARRLYHVYKKLGMTKEQNSLLQFLVTINDPKYIFIRAQKYYDKEDYDKSIAYTKIMLPTLNNKFRKLYADHLLYGHGIEKNAEKAKKYYIAAAEKYPKAVSALAEIYIKGIDCEPNLSKAQSIFFKSMQNSSYSSEAAYQKLYCDFCEEHEYYDLAFRLHKKIASSKKTKESQYKVAMTYLNPQHKECKKNVKKGFQFLKMSADQHHPQAAHELGNAYIFGKYGQKRDFDKGVQYLTSASRLNYNDSTFLLGKIYYRGIGTIPVLDDAYEFFEKAAKNGNYKAKYYSSLNEKLDYGLRQKYLVESANAGYDKAQYAYGKQLIDSTYGDTEDPDYEKGLKYLKKAANQKYKDAQNVYDKLTSKH